MFKRMRQVRLNSTAANLRKETRKKELLPYIISKMGSSKFVRVESVCIGICRLCGQDRVMESIYCVCLNTPA